MKIGFLTDTHENVEKIKAAVKLFNDCGVQYIFHGGDIISPIMASHFSKLNGKLKLVYGNNDGEILYLQEKFGEFASIHIDFIEEEIEGKRILVYHKPLFLEALIKSAHYDIILYGHTHFRDIRFNEKVITSKIIPGKAVSIDEFPLILNPGETCGYMTDVSSIAIIDLKDETVVIHEI